MLKKPNAPLPRTSAGGAMEVESTRVHVLADGRKLIDVMMRRPEDGAKQFDDDESSSSSDEESDFKQALPFYHSPQPQRQQINDADTDSDNNNTVASSHRARRASDPEAAAGGADATTFQGEFKWDGVGDIQQLTNANAQLTAQASEFKRQIKLLQIQLEALAPVPGLNPDTVQDLLLERDGATDHDIRDAKIVHQAKSVRHLKRSLQREKQLAVDATKQCKLLESAKQQLEREVETLKLKAARIQARANAAFAAAGNAQIPAAAAVVRPASDDDALELRQSGSAATSAPAADSSAKKKLDELRAKHDKLQLDVKKLQRALQREVGDDVSLDELLDGESGKRGRAQQIVILKAKVMKLEGELARSAAGTGNQAAVAAGVPPQLSNNVDARAQQELAAQHAQRQKLADRVSLERDELQERLAQQTKKLEAVKSRSQTLEKEKLESKGRFQVLVDKSRNDDALIDALQKQLETWRAKVHEAKRARTAESASSSSLTQQQLFPKSDTAAELERLRSLVAEYKRQQAVAPPLGMPAPSESAQFRTVAAEKERLQEVVKVLQSQLEEKERQAKQQQPLMPPSLTEEVSLVSRIPRKPGMPALVRGGAASHSNSSLPSADAPSQQPGMTAAEVEALRRSFRESIKAKEDQVAALSNRLHALQQQQRQCVGAGDEASALAQEAQDLQDENRFLRQEFDKLKTRYEALVRSAKSSGSSRKAT